MINLLINLYNVSLVQPSVFKCVSRECRNHVRSQNIDSRQLRLYSYELFCYFNVSPMVFNIHSKREKLERDIITSDDTDYLQAMYDIGWKYNFETMHKAISYSISVKMMRALRALGCHWGSETLDKIIEASSPGSMHKHLSFALDDGYPLIGDHVILAVTVGDAFTIRAVVNKFIETAQTMSTFDLTNAFHNRIQSHTVDETDEDMHDIIAFQDTLVAIGICQS